MATKILIPTPLRPYTDKKDAVEADGATVGELLADLTKKHSGLKAHLYNEQGKLRSFVNIYLTTRTSATCKKSRRPSRRATRSASSRRSLAASKGGGDEKTLGGFSKCLL